MVRKTIELKNDIKVRFHPTKASAKSIANAFLEFQKEDSSYQDITIWTLNHLMDQANIWYLAKYGYKMYLDHLSDYIPGEYKSIQYYLVEDISVTLLINNQVWFWCAENNNRVIPIIANKNEKDLLREIWKNYRQYHQYIQKKEFIKNIIEVKN